MKLVWRHRAELQLISQLKFLKDVNPHAAKRMRARVKRRLASLKHAPLTGRPSRQEGVRELVISGTPYIAVYEIADGVITILQFFHGSEDRG